MEDLEFDMFMRDGKPIFARFGADFSPSATALEVAMAALAMARVNAPPPVPSYPSDLLRPPAPLDPAIAAGFSEDGNAWLALRHPGFGWMRYYFSVAALPQLHRAVDTLLRSQQSRPNRTN